MHSQRKFSNDDASSSQPPMGMVVGGKDSDEVSCLTVFDSFSVEVVSLCTERHSSTPYEVDSDPSLSDSGIVSSELLQQAARIRKRWFESHRIDQEVTNSRKGREQSTQRRCQNGVIS